MLKESWWSVVNGGQFLDYNQPSTIISIIVVKTENHHSSTLHSLNINGVKIFGLTLHTLSSSEDREHCFNIS